MAKKVPFLLGSGKPLGLSSGGIIKPSSKNTLASIVGHAPACLNMLLWDDGTHTDFTWSGVGPNFNQSFTFGKASIGSSTTSPDGTNNARKLVENSEGGTHYVSYQVPTRTATTIPYRIAVIAKAAERSRIVLEMTSFDNSTTATVSACFDLAGGNAGFDNVSGVDITIIDTQISSLGSGWYLCTLDFHWKATSGGLATTWLTYVYPDSGTGTAARNINYNGDGSSGVYLWWWNVLPLDAWSIRTQAFYDDFESLATIDVNNTMAPGYNWYVNNLAPNSSTPTFDWSSTSLTKPTPASNLSISSPSVLKIYDPNNNADSRWKSMLWSVACPNAGGYVGNAWQAPLVFDGSFSWYGELAGSDLTGTSKFGGLGPAFWGSSVEALTNTGLTNTEFIELDVIDIGGSGLSVIDWNNSADPNTVVSQGFGLESNLFHGLVAGVFHRFSTLWLNIASGSSSWGLFLFFYDGQFIGNSDTAYSASDVGQGRGGTPVGILSSCDTHHLPVFMDTGTNVSSSAGGGWPMYVDWVKVYTS